MGPAGRAAVVEVANAPAGRGFPADNLQPCAARVANQIRQAFMGGDFYKRAALRVLRRKYAAALDGHADGARGAGKLIKCVDTLFIRIFSQQQPNVLPPHGADAFRIALRAGEKLPGLQERAANLVMNAGLVREISFSASLPATSCPYCRSRRFMASRRRLSFSSSC